MSADVLDLWALGLRATFRPRGVVEPDFANPVLMRGCLGAALMTLACVRDDADCSLCSRLDGCSIPTWFDPGRGPLGGLRPLALRSVTHDAQGLHVTWTLLSPPPDPELFLASLFRMGIAGFGRDRVSYPLSELVAWGARGPVVVVAGGQRQASLPPPPRLRQLVDELPDDAVVVLETPLKLDAQASKPDLQALIRAGIRRVRGVAALQGVRVEQRWDLPVHDAHWDIERREGARRSKRQGRQLDLSGWVGQARLSAEQMQRYGGLVAALAVLQVGRDTSCGLGVVEVRPA